MRMLQAAAASTAAFVLLLVLAYYVRPTEWLDAAALNGFAVSPVEHARLADLANNIAHLCNPVPYAIAATGVIATALVTRGARTAAAITIFLGGANVSSQILKPALAHHRDVYFTDFHPVHHVTDAAFPSGHATAAMAISVAILMIVPRVARPIAAALGAAFTVTVSFSLLVLEWHFPSDVVGGYLIATTWGLIGWAALTYANERWPKQGSIRTAAKRAVNPPRPGTIAVTLLFIAAAALGVAASRADDLARFADKHTAAAAVASAIAVAATVLLAAVAALSSRRSSR